MPSLFRPACLPASPSLCLGCPRQRQRQRQQRHTESDRREGRDFSCACLFCLPLSSACPPLAAASLLIYKNYIHTYTHVSLCVCVRIYRWEFIQCATCFGPFFPFYLLLLLPFAIYFAHIFVLAAFCCFVYISHGYSLSPCLSFDPFCSAIRRVNRMPLFLIRFFTSLLVSAAAAAASTHKQTNAVSLSHIYQHLHTRSAACRHCALALPFN